MDSKENIKNINKDQIRSRSLKEMSQESLKILKIIKFDENTKNMIFRELYEALRQDIESIGYSKGYKFRSHEAITTFLKEILKEYKLSILFDRYRLLRNKLNYYGKSINIETVEEAIEKIPKIIKDLEKYRK
jgi:hypothetical protein